jgi:ABC-type lipoprotein release transport system permease subunit
MAGPSLPAIAWRNLWRNGRRTVLTLVSIAFGFFLSVLGTSMQDRNWEEMIDLAARVGAGHVTVQHPEYSETPTVSRAVSGVAAVVAAAKADPRVSHAVPRVASSAMLSSATDSVGGMVVAFDPSQETEETMAILGAVTEGEPFTAADDRGALIGARLARQLDVEVGDKVVFTLMDRNGEIVAGMERVRALVRTGSDAVDGAMVLLPIDRVRGLLGYTADEATQIAIFAVDNRRSGRIAEALGQQIDGPVVLAWDEAQPELAGFIAMKVGGARFMELVTVLLVSAGIFNTLFVSVMERTREFGIQLAIGWSPRQISALVMWEAAWLGVVGIAAGGVLTWPLYAWLSEHGLDMSEMAGDQPLEVAGIGMSPVLKVGIFPENLAIIVVGVLTATLLAGAWPAWKAGRTAPVDAIKLV